MGIIVVCNYEDNVWRDYQRSTAEDKKAADEEGAWTRRKGSREEERAQMRWGEHRDENEDRRERFPLFCVLSYPSRCLLLPPPSLLPSFLLFAVLA